MSHRQSLHVEASRSGYLRFGVVIFLQTKNRKLNKALQLLYIVHRWGYGFEFLLSLGFHLLDPMEASIFEPP